MDGAVTLRVEGITSSSVFEFSVTNLSHDVMTIDRNGVRLHTASGDHPREPGGVQSTYTVTPGSAHDLNVKFSLVDLKPGERFAIDFDKAIWVGSKPVALEPLEFAMPPEDCTLLVTGC